MPLASAVPASYFPAVSFASLLQRGGDGNEAAAMDLFFKQSVGLTAFVSLIAPTQIFHGDVCAIIIFTRRKAQL